MSEQWLTYQEALEIVRAHISCSIGRAEATLQAARKSHEVRFENPADPILLLADDGIVGMRHSMQLTGHRSISNDDLLDWLSREHPPQENPATKPKKQHCSQDKTTPKQRAIAAAIKACFPGGLPADDITARDRRNATLQQWLKINRPGLSVSDRSIQRFVRAAE